jgi:GDP-4-dehydro-6-deoxy-D-mannose reductase
MAILITGATGFVGGHLIEHLLAAGETAITGTNRSGRWPDALSPHAKRCRLIACDLSHPAAAVELLRAVAPTQIYHLAGYANNGKSFREPDVAWQQNVFVTQNLFEAAARVVPHARIVFVSTGLIYGEPETDEAFTELSLLKPASPYAASKAAADLMAYQYTKSHDLAIVRARPFNHFGPRQSAEYALPNFARQIAAAVPVMETGDLTAKRDLTDVRDIVRGYRRLMANGRSGEAYNLGRGDVHGMDDMVAMLIARAGTAIRVVQKPSARRGDPAVTRCDAGKIARELGWRPEIAMDQSLDDLLESWKTPRSTAP